MKCQRIGAGRIWGKLLIGDLVERPQESILNIMEVLFRGLRQEN